MSTPTDHARHRLLVLRGQAGEEAALVELVRQYQPRLAYFVSKLLGRNAPAADVDDVLQDVWLDVIRGLPRLRDAATFPAWVYRIARDRTYRTLRRRGVHSLDAQDETAELTAEAPCEDDDQPFSEEDVALVHVCLDDLSPAHREVLVLRFLQDLSYEDVAGVARCTVGTVRSRLHYAKAALRRAMERKRPC
jgi:RNA polymerase sigma-70 factor (ECF subfamily)